MEQGGYGGWSKVGTGGGVRWVRGVGMGDKVGTGAGARWVRGVE